MGIFFFILAQVLIFAHWGPIGIFYFYLGILALVATAPIWSGDLEVKYRDDHSVWW